MSSDNIYLKYSVLKHDVFKKKRLTMKFIEYFR